MEKLIQVSESTPSGLLMSGESEGEGGGGVTGDGGANAGETVIISYAVLAFMHSWFQGNNH